MALKGSGEIGKLELKVPFKEGLSAPDFQAQKFPLTARLANAGHFSRAGTCWDAAGDPLRDGLGCSGIIYEALLHCT